MLGLTCRGLDYLWHCTAHFQTSVVAPSAKEQSRWKHAQINFGHVRDPSSMRLMMRVATLR